MLIRFKVENFLSFDYKQELNMLPGKRIKMMKDHLIELDKISLLRSATLFGANASGKSNFVEAFRFAKQCITKKIPIESGKMYCRANDENSNKESKFEFELFKNDKFYAYGFSLNLQKQSVVSEWLYELNPNNSSEKMLFEREITESRFELNSKINLSKNDLMRFETYKYDFEENTKSLFLTEMNRNKRLRKNSKLNFFKDVYEWFDEDIITIMPDQPITNFKYFYDNNSTSTINKLISIFDTGITKVKVENITPSDFKDKVPSKIVDEIMETFQNKFEDDDEVNEIMFSLRSYEEFFNINGKRGEEPIITTIKMEHGNSSKSYEFSEESDGTRRLFDLLDILLSEEENKIYIIDELERSLHPKLTYKFIDLFFEILKQKNIQLIFTTHESAILDQNLFRRDEIWFVERNSDNISFLYSLDRFKERYDKKLSKAYLEGRYGAIPIFKDFLFNEEDI